MTKTKEFEDLLPPLSDEEFAALKADIKTNGILHPVLVDENDDVLDGRHRLKIDKNAPRKVIRGLSDAEKEAFVFRANFTRRNLSPAQKADARRKMKATADRLRKEDAKKWTQKRVAECLGVSRETVRNWFTDKTISNGQTAKANKPDARVKLTPDQKQDAVKQVQSGKTQAQVAANFGVSQPAISNAVRAAEKTHSRDDDKARKTANLKSTSFELRSGDFREVLQDIEGVSLILTDPPYPKDSLPLWSDLGKWASEALAEDGLLIAYSGQMYLPQVLTLLSEHLEYWWCGAVVHKGSSNITPLGQPVRKVKNRWKPLVMFYRKDGDGFDKSFDDLLEGVGPEKDKHNWQQPEAEAGELIKRFTKQGELIVDPFAGSGGFCKAAIDLKRKAVGAEILA